MKFIDLKKQYKLIESDVQQAMVKVLEHGQYIMGPEIKQLEEELADYLGVKYAIVNSSGTDALLMSLMALGIKAGDEVITTPFSFFATAEVILLLGAKPVFIDIDEKTFNMDVTKLEAAITSRTKAIMPVSLYGQCADMDTINTIATSHGLPVIEDAAQSFGATYNNKKSCALSSVGCTSFFPSKPLGCYGDGGACFTNDDELAAKLLEVRIHGQTERYCHPTIGLNARMDTLQAAVLLEKLKLFPQEVNARQAVAKRYDDLLAGVVGTPVIESYNTSVYAQYTIRVKNRPQFVENMKKCEVPTAVHYPVPLHLQAALSHLNYNLGDFPVSEQVASEVVSLPMHPYLEESDQVKIASAVKESLVSFETETVV